MAWFHLRLARTTSIVAVVLTLSFVAGSIVRADEKPSTKSKTPKPNVVELDLSKLPPDLAKQLEKYTQNKKTPASKEPTPAAKPVRTDLPPGLAKKSPNHPGVKAFLAKQAAAKATPAAERPVELPPGLRNKPANHPGVKAFLEAHKLQPAPPSTSPSKKKSKGDQ